MAGTTEAFSRVKIDALLADAGWNLTDGVSVLFEHALPGGLRADYALCDRKGRPMAIVEAKRASINPIAAQDQGIHYATLLGVPFVFLSNGEEVWFLDRDTDAHARAIATIYSQEDLERRLAVREFRRELSEVPIDPTIIVRDTLRFFDLDAPTSRHGLPRAIGEGWLAPSARRADRGVPRGRHPLRAARRLVWEQERTAWP